MKKEIELRSEELQEILGRVPSWILRWGITGMALLVGVILLGCYLFKYPDTITAPIVLTDTHPPVRVVAKQSGKIARLFVSDGEKVEADSYLGVIENPASTDDLFHLRRWASGLLSASLDTLPPLPASDLKLGQVQSAYVQLAQNYTNYQTYQALDYYPHKIASLQTQIQKYRDYQSKQQQQLRIATRQYTLTQERHRLDSTLHANGVTSKLDFEATQAQLLSAENALIQTESSIDNLGIQITQLESTLLDTRLQQNEKEWTLERDLRNSLEVLLNDIKGWELNYVLRSTVGGTVSFPSVWSENQNVKAGDEVFVVIPDHKQLLIGKVALPPARAGKVKVGQRVLVRFDNFPDQEFGTVPGLVKQVSPVPTNGNYPVEVSFPQGLLTNYGKQLPRSPEMTGSADIVTEELRVIERFFLPLKKILKNNL